MEGEPVDGTSIHRCRRFKSGVQHGPEDASIRPIEIAPERGSLEANTIELSVNGLIVRFRVAARLKADVARLERELLGPKSERTKVPAIDRELVAELTDEERALRREEAAKIQS